jgi:hypothetical protein
MLNMSFGNGAVRARDQYHSARSGPVETPASDWYSGPQEFDQPEGQIVGSQWVLTGRITKQIGRASQSVYDKTIPLHAVRKIAQIEKEHKGPAYFFVCDYALAPAIEHPDPFLMVCVPNPKLKIGVGRFVIDFWDEPGFGLERMLKPA